MGTPSARAIWFTGLPSAGKTTLAEAVAAALRARKAGVEVLDGDALRATLHSDLGFDRASRREQALRTARRAAAVLMAGNWPLVALVSPFAADRAAAYALLPGVVEVHVATAAATCAARDAKGLWMKARAGLITGFTGLDSPYEEPADAAVVYDAGAQSVADGVAAVLAAAWR